MRCEHCGCVGVEVVDKLDTREKARVIFLGAFMFKPALKYAATVKTQPYCVRCRKRVRGDGVARRDLMCDFNPDQDSLRIDADNRVEAGTALAA